MDSAVHGFMDSGIGGLYSLGFDCFGGPWIHGFCASVIYGVSVSEMHGIMGLWIHGFWDSLNAGFRDSVIQ